MRWSVEMIVYNSKAFTPVRHFTVSKINSFKVLQTIILQGLKWKSNPDCWWKVSTEDLLWATTEKIQFGTVFDSPVLEGNHQGRHLLIGVSQCNSARRHNTSTYCLLSREFLSTTLKKKKILPSRFGWMLINCALVTKTLLLSFLHLLLGYLPVQIVETVYSQIQQHI